jgi:hypothetical protein
MVLAVVASLSFTVVACGTDQTGRITETQTAQVDQALAQRWNLRLSDLGTGWQQVGSAGDAVLKTCPVNNTMAAGLAFGARSPTFEHARRLELRTGAYVYTSRAAARQALTFIFTTAQACIGRAFVAALRHDHYTTGQPRIGPSATISLGDTARIDAIQIPVKYQAQQRTFSVDTTVVLMDRVVGVLVTFTGRATPALGTYDQALAAVLVKRVRRAKDDGNNRARSAASGE